MVEHTKKLLPPPLKGGWEAVKNQQSHGGNGKMPMSTSLNLLLTWHSEVSFIAFKGGGTWRKHASTMTFVQLRMLFFLLQGARRTVKQRNHHDFTHINASFSLVLGEVEDKKNRLPP